MSFEVALRSLAEYRLDDFRQRFAAAAGGRYDRRSPGWW
jgi:hypothetical protein